MDEAKQGVLFVVSCQNYKAFQGFRLNNPSYTAYPYEEEVLLCEGCEVIVLSINELKIENNNDNFKPFNNKSLTIIHMFLPDKLCENHTHAL